MYYARFPSYQSETLARKANQTKSIIVMEKLQDEPFLGVTTYDCAHIIEVGF